MKASVSCEKKTSISKASFCTLHEKRNCIRIEKNGDKVIDTVDFQRLVDSQKLCRSGHMNNLTESFFGRTELLASVLRFKAVLWKAKRSTSYAAGGSCLHSPSGGGAQHRIALMSLACLDVRRKFSDCRLKEKER